MGWEQLKAIYDEGRLIRRAEEQAPPVACPNDGEPLEEGPGGTLHCPFDGWKWDGSYPVN